MRVFLLHIFIGLSFLLKAQESYYSTPVDIPMLLSGSFAELRSNHFHSGIDIKTQGATGLPVYTVADGHISRIVVSPSGFGKALYIQHPNGTTSVYAHLQKFEDSIDRYIKEKQYEKQSFRVDLPVPHFLFPVKKGDEIGKSGNSGSSGGPHVHFEIRDTKTEEPLNPLKYGFPVTDNIAPKVFSLQAVPLSKGSLVNQSPDAKSFSVVFYDGKYHLKGNTTLLLTGKIGLAIQTNDYFNESYNKCGINFLSMSIDEETQFAFQLNRFSFANSRYINSHIVYGEYMDSKRRFIKTWLEPGNKLPIYNHNGSMGIISPKNGQTQKVEIELKDTYGNTSILQFSIKGSIENFSNGNRPEDHLFLYDQSNQYTDESVEVIIPKGALYDNFSFIYSTTAAPDTFYSDYHFIHNQKVPLHKNATIRIKANGVPEQFHSKVVMVNVDTVSDEFYSIGGIFNNGWVETSTRTFGTYAVAIDTVPPEITTPSIKSGALTESTRIRFKVSDDLSGIKRIEGYLDGKWALFDYDAKSGTITHYFDKSRFDFNKQHSFKLSVSDYRANTTIYESTFWK